jgi:hypothetical protein
MSAINHTNVVAYKTPKTALGRGVVLLAGNPFIGLVLDGGATCFFWGLAGALVVAFFPGGTAFSAAFTTELVLKPPWPAKALLERRLMATGAKADVEAIKKAISKKRRILKVVSVVSCEWIEKIWNLRALDGVY